MRKGRWIAPAAFVICIPRLRSRCTSRASVCVSDSLHQFQPAQTRELCQDSYGSGKAKVFQPRATREKYHHTARRRSTRETTFQPRVTARTLEVSNCPMEQFRFFLSTSHSVREYYMPSVIRVIWILSTSRSAREDTLPYFDLAHCARSSSINDGRCSSRDTLNLALNARNVTTVSGSARTLPLSTSHVCEKRHSEMDHLWETDLSTSRSAREMSPQYLTIAVLQFTFNLAYTREMSPAQVSPPTPTSFYLALCARNATRICSVEK